MTHTTTMTKEMEEMIVKANEEVRKRRLSNFLTFEYLEEVDDEYKDRLLTYSYHQVALTRVIEDNVFNYLPSESPDFQTVVEICRIDSESRIADIIEFADCMLQ